MINRNTLNKHLKAIHNHSPDYAIWPSVATSTTQRQEFTCNEVAMELRALQERDRDFITSYSMTLSFSLTDFTPSNYPVRGDLITYKDEVRRVLDTQITPDSQELRTHLGARYQR